MGGGSAPRRPTAAAVFLGLAPSALGFVAWGYGVARLPVTVATASLYLVPPIAILVGYVWLGDRPTAIELIGGGIAIGGVVVASRRPGKATARDERPAEPWPAPSQNTRV